MKNTEELEINLLLQAVKELHGIDYTNYRSSYIRRRIERRMELEGLTSITSLTDKMIHNPFLASKLWKDISINVTDMFRCPLFFQHLKKEVIPTLKTYPSIRIWHSGCSSGEEILSMAILLKEEGILHKTSILATDINEDILDQAKKAIYKVERLRNWTENYNLAGGENSFSAYYDVRYNQAKFDETLLDRVTFKTHNLLEDSYPKDMHLILCRNVLIYFKEEQQESVVRGFHRSLIRSGYLGLGFKETIKPQNKDNFRPINSKYKIYQRVEQDA